MFVSTEFDAYKGSVMAIDPSGRGSDELGVAIIKQLNGNLYLHTCKGLQGGYSEGNLITLAKMARDAEVNMVIVESNFGDGMFTQLLKPVINKYHPVTIEEVSHSKQKELRIIDTLEPLLNQHRLIVSPQLIRADFDTNDPHYQLFYQLTRITKDRGCLRNDDRLDALAIGVAYWIEQLAVDSTRQVEDFKDRKLQAELDRFMEHAVGRKTNRDSWIKI